jgi:hypothetical protein
MNADKDKLDSLTERVLGAVIEVTNTLGGVDSTWAGSGWG